MAQRSALPLRLLVFGADVSLQKARTATFFSGTGRLNGSSPADLLRGLPAPKYLASVAEPVDGEALANNLSTLDSPSPQISDYVSALQDFLGVRDALEATGEVVAFADRSGGNLSRPNYPDGPSSGPPGPLSKPPGVSKLQLLFLCRGSLYAEREQTHIL